MALLSLSDVNLALGGPKLLDNINLQIEQQERICLLGRNGCGKTTLLRVLGGELQPDSGKISRQRGIKIALLPQEVPESLAGKTFDIVVDGMGETTSLLKQYHELSHQLTDSKNEKLLSRLSSLQQQLDHSGGWETHRRVEQIIKRLGLDPDAPCENLSAGLKRRILLAITLVGDPDILLLDEPTNHLDIPSIKWLEDFLASYQKTLLFVSHDRRFLSRLATRILELDRGALGDWNCPYETFLQRKEAALAVETRQRAAFDRKMAEEEVWIRKGIKARRTRNEGRVRALQKMREERSQRREQTGQARMQLQSADKTGKEVIKVIKVDFAYTEDLIIKELNTTIQRGDRIGIIGANGTGKTTLQRLLIGELSPDSGEIIHGTNLSITYFDQLRDQLDDTISVMDNVAGSREILSINGKQRHTISYLQDFLFTPEQSRSLTSVLSGGERNRLLLARLFASPSNVIVLDEPTNDLDIETLEMLEEILLEYSGTVIMVSHDRAFLNNTVTSTLVLDGQGNVKEYAGGYDDWSRQSNQVTRTTTGKKVKQPGKSPCQTKKLSYQEQRDLNALPDKIARMEQEQQRLYKAMASPSFYQQPPDQIARTQARLTVMENQLTDAYARWEELEERREEVES